MTSTRSYTCAWCGSVSNGSSLNCPSCGAAIDTRTATTVSGWAELPGRRDMSKIQFGGSSCQIEGTYVPIADLNLAKGDSVYFAHHTLLWMEPTVTVQAMPLKGAWKRMLAGLPIIMTEAYGPGHIAFSRDEPGEMLAVPLQAGQSIDVREHLFLVATSNIHYDWFSTNIWYSTRSGDETETFYPVGILMDRFTASQQPGLLMLHAAGNAFIRHLAQGQSILVKPTALLFKDPTVQMQLHIEYPGTLSWSPWMSWSHRQFWLRLYGPGRVAVQSAYDEFEDNGNSISSHSGATQRQW